MLNILDIWIWVDQLFVNLVFQFKDLLFDMDLFGSCIGVEFGVYGMCGDIVFKLSVDLISFVNIEDMIGLVFVFRFIKSVDEIVCIW